MSELSHFDRDGAAHMVDISEKNITERVAVAQAKIRMNKTAWTHLRAGSAKKGDVVGTARLAAIMGSKRTADLIPLCHPLPLTNLSVSFSFNDEKQEVTLFTTAKTTGKTGVEMEALTAASIGALTVYDMLKAVDKSMVVSDMHLVEKSGGKSGDFRFSSTND